MTVLNSYLRKALLADAIVSSVASAGMIAGSGVLAAPFGLPSELLLWAGIACVPFVALIAWVLRGAAAPAGAVVAIIGINIAWVIASLIVAFGSAFATTLFGKVFVVAQAATVALFAELQIIGLRRARAVA